MRGARPFMPAPTSPCLSILSLGLLALGACSSSDDDGAGQQAPPGQDPEFLLDTVSNGFGQQLPHLVAVEDLIGQTVLEPLRTVEDLKELVTSTNLVQPPVAFPADAVLPDSRPGNQFFLAKFTEAVDADSDCFNACTGTAPCEFEVFEVLVFDPATHEASVVPARVFVGGYTRNANGDLEQWVRFDSASGELVLTSAEAVGFPGSTAPQLNEAAAFVAPGAIMVVMDSDDDLSTLEAFPNTGPLQLRIPASLCSITGQFLEIPAVATTNVGGSTEGPHVAASEMELLVEPVDGAQAVDPTTNITLRFTDSVQPWTVGSLAWPNVHPGVTVTQAPDIAPVPHAFSVVPRSAYDLTEWTLLPDRSFNGLNPEGPPIVIELAEVGVLVDTGHLSNLAGQSSAGATEFSFLIHRGPSLVNAPIVPESLILSRGGARPGLSVLDLNGFGQSTGSPTYSLPMPFEGQTRFPFDPNVTGNPTIRPLLNPGTSMLDGGSAGVFTLTLDANMNSVLAGAPILADASDLQFGSSLDVVFDNSPPPFGCQSGGGNVCALTGLKSLSQNPALPLQVGFPNLVSFAPHPNPPRLEFPVQCGFPSIVGREPSSVDSGSTQNLLQTGNPFPDPSTSTPPTGLLAGRRPTLPFYGPSFDQISALDCSPFGVRQQIGQFLYVVDRSRGEVTVLNSNRMIAIDRIPVTGATTLAISPNLDILAVASTETDSVTLIDVNPASATFHEAVAAVAVGRGPRGLAFDPLDEDILVCNELDNTLSVISAQTLLVRSTVPSRVDAPFDLAVTPRMDGFAFERGVYFAYIVGRNGEVAIFESGPDGTGGWGYDTTVGVLPYVFQAPRAIVLDPLNLNASVYIAYEGPVDPATGVSGALGDGAISRIELESAATGLAVVQAGSTPSLRDLDFGVTLTLSQSAGEINGIPSSLAFDELTNFADHRAPVSIFTSGSPAPFNGKAAIREVTAGLITPTSLPKFLFAALPGEGLVDVLQVDIAGMPLLDTNVYDPGVQSIPAPDVRFLAGYFSQ